MIFMKPKHINLLTWSEPARWKAIKQKYDFLISEGEDHYLASSKVASIETRSFGVIFGT